jgi:hypothetical protein
MLRRHRNYLALTTALLVVVWLIAWGGYRWAQNARVTGEKVQAYLQSVDLRQLPQKDRAQALNRLAAQLNALSPEERRKARLDSEWERWFKDMTEEEKVDFLEATVPTGFKQMLESFEQLPEDKRKRAIETAYRRLREAQEQIASGNRPAPGTPPAPYLSEEFRQRIIKLGLKAYYSESSAQTKAELAPLLEEIQGLMERNPGYVLGHGH